jgi:hypothetical protein
MQDPNRFNLAEYLQEVGYPSAAAAVRAAIRLRDGLKITRCGVYISTYVTHLPSIEAVVAHRKRRPDSPLARIFFESLDNCIRNGIREYQRKERRLRYYRIVIQKLQAESESDHELIQRLLNSTDSPDNKIDQETEK